MKDGAARPLSVADPELAPTQAYDEVLEPTQAGAVPEIAAPRGRSRSPYGRLFLRPFFSSQKRGISMAEGPLTGSSMVTLGPLCHPCEGRQ